MVSGHQEDSTPPTVGHLDVVVGLTPEKSGNLEPTKMHISTCMAVFLHTSVFILLEPRYDIERFTLVILRL